MSSFRIEAVKNGFTLEVVKTDADEFSHWDTYVFRTLDEVFDQMRSKQ